MYTKIPHYRILSWTACRRMDTAIAVPDQLERTEFSLYVDFDHDVFVWGIEYGHFHIRPVQPNGAPLHYLTTEVIDKPHWAGIQTSRLIHFNIMPWPVRDFWGAEKRWTMRMATALGYCCCKEYSSCQEFDAAKRIFSKLEEEGLENSNHVFAVGCLDVDRSGRITIFPHFCPWSIIRRCDQLPNDEVERGWSRPFAVDL